MSQSQPKVGKLAVYSTTSGVVLGTKTTNEITGVFLVHANQVTGTDFAKLAKARMRDEMTTVCIGVNDTFSKRTLSTRETLSFNVVALQLAEAKKAGDNWVVENIFDELRGK